MTPTNTEVKRRSGVAAGPRRRPAFRRRAAEDGRLLAGLQLPLGRADLSPRQSAFERTAQARAHQAAVARPLGHVAGLEHALRSPQSRHQARRPERDLRHRAGARRAVAGRPCLPGRHLQRGLSEYQPGRRGNEEAVQAVQLPRRHPQPRRPETPGSHPRRRRTGLRPEPRLRRRVRQPRPDRRLRRRRRRGGDRAARHRLARQQVPQPGPRRLRAADPAPQRLQDRQPLLPGPHPPGGTAEVLRRHGLQAVLRRGTRTRCGPPAIGRRARHCVAEIKQIWAEARADGADQTSGLADDRLPHAEGLDLPAGNRRQEVRGLLAVASSADGRHGQARAHQASSNSG